MDTISYEAPRTNDGSIDILGLTRQLVEAALNEIMDVQADEASCPAITAATVSANAS